jgi:acyl-coenzyme A synthetase/AMP-(fatty) acid ligase
MNHQGILYQQIAKNACQAPTKIAVISDTLTINYEQLIQGIDCLAQTLINLYPKQKPIRLLSICEQPEHNLQLALALAKINGTLIPLNAQTPAQKLIQSFEFVDADYVVADHKRIPIQLSDKSLQWQNLIEKQSNHNAQKVSDQACLPHDSFLISMSSGSTGQPKPIVLSQQAKLNRANQSIKLYAINGRDVVLNASPFFHSLGQRLSFVPLVAGATLVYLKHFTPKSWISLVEQHQVTFSIPVASHLYALQPLMELHYKELQPLRCLVTSSAPIDVNFKKRMKDEVGCQFHEIYGASEIASVSNLAPEDFAEKYKTVGKPIGGVKVKILDEKLNELAVGQIGEIAVQSPLRFTEYYAQPELTKIAFTQDYFLTGDLGFIDVDGYLSYVSRKKDVIISGGINIYPIEIEKCLLATKLIKEVCVIGVEDKMLGEVVLAICVGDRDVEMKLRKQANIELISYQRPIRYFFVKSLPLTPSGKVDKMTLRATYNAMNEDWSDAIRQMMYQEI